ESLSENLSDSVLAPLLYYALFGLAGAALYRYANTADAMWGYPAHELRGAFAARADDLLNLLPARLTGLLLCPPRLWPRLLQEARKTPSPNAGFPMAALALRLGVRLRKRGAYALNPEAPSLGPRHIRLALGWARAIGCGIGLVLTCTLL
ncbi:CobD/CbiB family cobalamin biosynthesis protein, partial [Thermus tengchongensis]